MCLASYVLRSLHLPRFAGVRTKDFVLSERYTLRVNSRGIHRVDWALGQVDTFYDLRDAWNGPGTDAIQFYLARHESKAVQRDVPVFLSTSSRYPRTLPQPVGVRFNGQTVCTIGPDISAGQTPIASLNLIGPSHYFIFCDPTETTTNRFLPYAPGGYSPITYEPLDGKDAEFHIGAGITHVLFHFPKNSVLPHIVIK